MKKYPFLFCGFTGLCLEILWTGLHSLLRGDASMKGTTSLLMFPIYGCASLILPVYKKLKSLFLHTRHLLPAADCGKGKEGLTAICNSVRSYYSIRRRTLSTNRLTRRFFLFLQPQQLLILHVQHSSSGTPVCCARHCLY